VALSGACAAGAELGVDGGWLSGVAVGALSGAGAGAGCAAAVPANGKAMSVATVSRTRLFMYAPAPLCLLVCSPVNLS
jgi:hypothetical protein